MSRRFISASATLISSRGKRALDPPRTAPGRRADHLGDDEAIVSGGPANSRVVQQNSRCSILHHFDVPGRIAADTDNEPGFIGELLQPDHSRIRAPFESPPLAQGDRVASH
jgi:hypothetical protein